MEDMDLVTRGRFTVWASYKLSELHEALIPDGTFCNTCTGVHQLHYAEYSMPEFMEAMLLRMSCCSSAWHLAQSVAFGAVGIDAIELGMGLPKFVAHTEREQC